MKKTILFALCALSFVATSCVHTQLMYPAGGKYKNLSGQGMAIWGDNAYLFNHTGLCRVYDLKSQSVTAEFFIGSTGETTHVNSANFGREIPEGGDKPALYVGECKVDGRCFVENMLDDRSEWIQTITAVRDSANFQMKSWAVDAENGFIYGISRGTEFLDEDETVLNTIHKFRLPRLDEGKEVVFTEDDELDSFSVPFANIIQGMEVRGKYLYVVSGLQQSSSARKDSRRAIKVIDLEKKVMKKDIDLTYEVINEPEDIAFHNNMPLLFCGQEGGIYRIKL